MDLHCLCDHGQSHRTLLPSLIDIFNFSPRGSCRISIPSILSVSIRFSRAFLSIELHHPPDLVDIHHLKFTLLSVEGLFAYVVLAACFQERYPFVRHPQHPYLLFGRISFAFHYLRPFQVTQTNFSSGPGFVVTTNP